VVGRSYGSIMAIFSWQGGMVGYSRTAAWVWCGISKARLPHASQLLRAPTKTARKLLGFLQWAGKPGLQQALVTSLACAGVAYAPLDLPRQHIISYRRHT